MLQRDSDLKHTTTKTRQFFQNCKIKVSTFVDINPIKNLYMQTFFFRKMY